MSNYKINYCTRAKFYDYEIKEKKNINNFLIKVINSLNNKVIMDIPCATGKRINLIAPYVNKCYFVDVEEEMIKIVNKKILKFKINNCQTIKMKLQDLIVFSDLECIFLFDQAIQYLNKNEIIKFLKKFNNKKIKIFIDMYNFKLNPQLDELEYFNCKESENKFVFDIEFKFEGKIIKRYRKYSMKEDGIEIVFKYDFINLTYETDIFLYNYTFEEMVEMCAISGVRILNVYSSYNFDEYKKENSRMIFEIVGDTI